MTPHPGLSPTLTTHLVHTASFGAGATIVTPVLQMTDLEHRAMKSLT